MRAFYRIFTKRPTGCESLNRLPRSAGGNGLKLREENNYVESDLFMLELAALGVTLWQMGFLFGIPGARVKPDYTITLTAFTAAIVFFGLCLASIIHREKSPDRSIT